MCCGRGLQGGILNKARRGELEMRPPVGLVYNSEGALVLDPDQQVQHCLQWLFATFAPHRLGLRHGQGRTSSGHLAFPRRCAKGAHKGNCSGAVSTIARCCASLHNPQVCRRVRLWALPYAQDARRRHAHAAHVPRDEWDTLIPGCARGLHLLGRVRAQPATPARERAGNGR